MLSIVTSDLKMLADETNAKSFVFAAIVIFPPAPPSLNVRPAPAARTLSAFNDPVASRTTNVASLSPFPLPTFAFMCIDPFDPVVTIILSPP